MQFEVFEKFTSACFFQIARETILYHYLSLIYMKKLFSQIKKLRKLRNLKNKKLKKKLIKNPETCTVFHLLALYFEKIALS